jgi:hypothetical protein
MTTQELAYTEIERLVINFKNMPGSQRSGMDELHREDDLDRVRNLEKQIAQVDAEIDRRVYRLYGLTEEQIKIVEGGRLWLIKRNPGKFW